MNLNEYLTAFISLGVAVIMYRQWYTEEAKRRQELFELRYEKILKKYFEFIDEFNDIIKTKESFNGEKYNFCTSKILADLFKVNFLISKSDYDRILDLHKKILNKAHEIICGTWQNPGDEWRVRVSFYFFLDKKKEEVYKIMEKYLRAEDTGFFDKYFPSIKNGFNCLKNILSKECNIYVLWQGISQKIFITLKRGGIAQKLIRQVNSESAKGARSRKAE